MKVLIVDDDVQYRSEIAEIVSSWGYQTLQAGDGIEALALYEWPGADIILTDLVMPRVDGFELLQRLRSRGRMPPVILLTAFGSLDKAIHTIHELDGFWFLEKPLDLTALELLLRRASVHSRLASENLELRRQLSFNGVLGDMVGCSAAMQEIFALIRQVAPTAAPVMVTGESGTGKELVARALHSHSLRPDGPFVAINCAALPETLIESEIFGHERGAFTGALERRVGAIEAAQGGTLFLDELGEMPLSMQAKLLRVLEDLKFRRLGGKHEYQADVRIVAATNRDPRKAIDSGLLREDLYYRLNVFQITLPPLRERKEDIPIIVNTMITALNTKHGTTVQGASEAFLEMLRERSWEGNIRELRNVLERAVILARGGVLEPRHAASGGTNPPARLAMVAAATAQRGQRVPVSVGMTLDEAERALIESTLSQTGNNKTRAAAILGISTKTMHVKLRQYRLAGDSPNSAAEEGA